MLITNIFIAIGTIGAAAVALWLGVSAQSNSVAQNREIRLKLTRQILAVYHPPRQGHGSSVEIVNASPEVVTWLIVQVDANPSTPGSEAPQWIWGEESLGQAFPMVSYLLPGNNVILEGAFWSPTALTTDGRRVLPGSSSVTVGATAVSLELMWEDSYGQVWNKGRGIETFPTGWAAPWRDHRDYLPRYQWPSHWPPKTVERSRPPLQHRITHRARSIVNRLRLPRK